MIQKLIGKEIVVSLDIELTGICRNCSSMGTTSCVVLMDLFRRVEISIGGLAQERARETKKYSHGGPGPIVSRGGKNTPIHGHAQAHTDTYTSTCTQHKHRSLSKHEFTPPYASILIHLPAARVGDLPRPRSRFRALYTELK